MPYLWEEISPIVPSSMLSTMDKAHLVRLTPAPMAFLPAISAGLHPPLLTAQDNSVCRMGQRIEVDNLHGFEGLPNKGIYSTIVHIYIIEEESICVRISSETRLWNNIRIVLQSLLHYSVGHHALHVIIIISNYTTHLGS